jgi:hypothetical protein
VVRNVRPHGHLNRLGKKRHQANDLCDTCRLSQQLGPQLTGEPLRVERIAGIFDLLHCRRGSSIYIEEERTCARCGEKYTTTRLTGGVVWGLRSVQWTNASVREDLVRLNLERLRQLLDSRLTRLDFSTLDPSHFLRTHATEALS